MAVLKLPDPSDLVSGTATWRDVQAAFGHARSCRAEDYVTAVLYRLLRDGSVTTRRVMVAALLAGQRREVLRRVAAHGPLTAAAIWTSFGPDLALYDERGDIVLVVENKLDGGPSQASSLARLLARCTPDLTLSPGVDFHQELALDPELWQLDSYAVFHGRWVPFDLQLVAAGAATWVFWTGSATATAQSAYVGAHTAESWKTTRHAETAEFLRPHLGRGVFAPEDEPWADLLLRMLRVPWRGPRRPESYLPLCLSE